MASFTLALQSLFAICAILSDYLTAFDQWILIATIPYQIGGTRQPWISTLTACLTYAVLEPLFYWVMTSVSSIAMWWFLMACWIHLTMGVPGLGLVVSKTVLQMKDRHEQDCLPQQPSVSSIRSGSDEDIALPATKQESFEDSRATTPEIESGPGRSHLDSASTFLSCGKHGLPLVCKLAPLLPIATSAATNAGLLFYTRYMSTEDSQAWMSRFAFGWNAIALLALFCFGMAKFTNRLMSLLFSKQTRGMVVLAAAGYKAANLVILVVFRAFVRVLLSQDAWTVITVTPDHSGLQLSSRLEIAEDTGNPKGDHAHGFDRFLAKIPPWVGPVTSVINVSVALGLFIIKRRRAR